MLTQPLFSSAHRSTADHRLSALLSLSSRRHRASCPLSGQSRPPGCRRHPLRRGGLVDDEEVVEGGDHAVGAEAEAAVTDEPLVSRDFNGDRHSSTVDAPLTTAIGDQVKVMSWYDNEIGYSQRLLDLARFVAERV